MNSPNPSEDSSFVACKILKDALIEAGEANARRCYDCGEDVCILDQYWTEFCALADTVLEMDKSPKESRFKMYKLMSGLLHGYLGKGCRMELPVCISDAIKHQFPEPDGKYVGYKESNKGNKK